MSTAIVTSIYGRYDVPKPLPADHGFDDAVFVTDVELDVPGWRTLVVPSDFHPRMAAKRPKCVPWEFTDADCSVWIDGAYAVRGAFREVVDRHLADADLVVGEHPEPRADAFEEAAFCSAWLKYRDWPLSAQIAAYGRAGLPAGSGLWACGTVARRHTTKQMVLGYDWLTECHAWSIQDQVSFPFVCWRAGVVPATWEEPVSSWLDWYAHRDES